MDDIIKRLDKKLKVIDYKYEDDTIYILKEEIKHQYVHVAERYHTTFVQDMLDLSRIYQYKNIK